jgi:hypothetical protein
MIDARAFSTLIESWSPALSILYIRTQVPIEERISTYPIQEPAQRIFHISKENERIASIAGSEENSIRNSIAVMRGYISRFNILSPLGIAH